MMAVAMVIVPVSVVAIAMVSIIAVTMVSVVAIPVIAVIAIAVVAVVAMVAFSFLILAFLLVRGSCTGQEHAATNAGAVGAAGQRGVLNMADQAKRGEVIRWPEAKALLGRQGAACDCICLNEYGSQQLDFVGVGAA